METLAAVLVSVIGAATPLVFAAVGELVAEKSGVLNLGVEGMMLIGAVAAFAAALTTGSATLGILAGAGAGAILALIFALLTLTLLANQVATGLALTIFGVGVSALIGRSFVGIPLQRLQQLDLPGLSDLPIVGTLLFGHDILVYLSILLIPATIWFLDRSQAGLILRSIGENHAAAHALGHPVIAVRYLAVMFGGAMAGLGGAYLSLAYTPMWAENMTAGRGWIALALVVFATWRPGRLLLGAYLFGGITVAQLHVQGFGFDVPSQFLSMLPYVATIGVLVAISADGARARLNAPGSLGRIFHPDA
jgi:simple sugar transport system permease protein